jgi:hypothetical protein
VPNKFGRRFGLAAMQEIMLSESSRFVWDDPNFLLQTASFRVLIQMRPGENTFSGNAQTTPEFQDTNSRQQMAFPQRGGQSWLRVEYYYRRRIKIGGNTYPAADRDNQGGDFNRLGLLAVS